MSADNGIYILKTRTMDGAYFPSEYRVLHAQAIENIYYNAEAKSDLEMFHQDSTFTPEIAYDHFKECLVFHYIEKAMTYAHQLAEEQPILEYGVSILDHGKQVFETFTDKEMAAFEKRSDEIMAANRKERDGEMEARRAAATIRLALGDVFHATHIVGYVDGLDGGRIYGQLSGPGAEDIRMDSVEKFIDFLPNDWNERKHEEKS